MSTHAGGCVRMGEEQGAMRLTLSRPEKRNALTPAMLDELLRGIRAHPRRVLLLDGDGDAFCAGFDLTLCRQELESGEKQPTALRDLLSGLWACVRALREHPMPVVVCAHGAALAGGCALVSAADVAIADDNAKLGYPVVRLGVSPAVSAETLRLAMGDGAARARLLDTALLRGQAALRAGLVHECLPDAQRARERAAAVASGLTGKPAHALRATKEWCREVEAATLHATLGRGLPASLGLVGGAEERALLPAAWTR